MFILVTYDIVDNSKRNKIAKILMDFGTRVQYSVFECNVSYEQLARLKKRLTKLVNERDSVRYYSLCASCREKVKIDGSGEVTYDSSYYMA